MSHALRASRRRSSAADAAQKPVMVDVIGTRHGFEKPLRTAAERNGLDAEALIAAATAAIAAPDRPVRLDVGVRAAA
jgi:hypothetical protein